LFGGELYELVIWEAAVSHGVEKYGVSSSYQKIGGDQKIWHEKICGDQYFAVKIFKNT